MCNAWNHPKNCSCGWGGDGQPGRSTNAYSAPATHGGWLISLTNTYHSYVNPNASCPVCGTAVFFYQSPSGGRVFFDELGPPWSKHPCTDTISPPGKAPHSSRMTGQSTVYSWQRAGWQPFIIEAVVGIDKDYLKLTGVCQGQHPSIYLRRLVTHHQHHQVLSEHNLAQIKTLGDGHFQLSILLPQGSPITLDAYALLAQARDGRSKPVGPAKPTPTDKRTASFNKLSNPRRPNFQREPKKSTERAPATTAMALAFCKAQERQGHS
ncbi:hypothetical protein ALP36_00578 [Pseudomonas syringae pv. coriandricola]|uniref:Uncharacterized protein n=1 Tax=Pseudomonas syringae pv. coriandricola TaxID=264453 RepID=A0A3M4U648_9PSED|nr:hypothetical protein ALP87_00250 [Pseudomonas syringae pv. coriandricola]RMU09448.1 hypothetical protein ALP36_00578 [Pseudomonas syringae pv. coriandricola]